MKPAPIQRRSLCCLLLSLGLLMGSIPSASFSQEAPAAPATPTPAAPAPAAPAPAPAQPTPAQPPVEAPAEPDDDSELSAEQREIAQAMVARPVSGEPVQVFGWRENVMIKGAPEAVIAKLDTGARTSSIHVENVELFERDGRKWVRFVFTDPTKEKSFQVKIDAPLVRVVLIKEPGGKSVPREVVKLGLQIGERKLSGEFTLNNRSNMLSPVLIGRTMLQELGVVDPGRVHLAEKKVFLP